MVNLYGAVQGASLFDGIAAQDFPALLACVQGRVAHYKKDDVVLLAGDAVDYVGLVVSGCVHIVREDSEGSQNLLAELARGEVFGEVFACAGIAASPVTVLAAQAADVLHLNYRRVVTSCSSACAFHGRLVENMLALLARKNLMLNEKISILSQRTTRRRVLRYFDFVRGGKRQFTIPYAREELAAYLCVDRSALSAELSKMQREGLIRFSRNSFTLL